MTRTSVLLGLIAVSFVTAEAVRPTRVAPKKLSTNALVLRSQAATGDVSGSANTLDSALLDGLPRIHPDAVGSVRVSDRAGDALTLSGSIAEPEGAAGAAVFIVDGTRRLGTARAHYGTPPRPTQFAIELRSAELAAGIHALQIGLVSADQRGFFLLPNPVAVRVGASSCAKQAPCGR